jgi:hypothetical protein
VAVAGGLVATLAAAIGAVLRPALPRATTTVSG